MMTLGSADPDISDLELDEIYKFAIQLGKDAGQMLMDGLEAQRQATGSDEGLEEKMNAVDIVTKTDTGMVTFCLCLSRFEYQHANSCKMLNALFTPPYRNSIPRTTS